MVNFKYDEYYLVNNHFISLISFYIHYRIKIEECIILRKLLGAITLIIGLTIITACGGKDNIIVESDAGNVEKNEFYEELIKTEEAESVLRNIVMIKILEENYEVTDEEVNDRLDELKEQIGEDFEDILEAQNISEDDLKSDIKISLLQEMAISEDVEVSDDEIADYYEKMKYEIKASHILVDDEELANEIKEKLDDGEDFEKLAKKHSTDGSADNGGDLGFFTVDNMVPEFENAAYELDVDEISDPVQSDHGYHIILLTDKKEAEDIGTLEENKNTIKQKLIEKKVTPEEITEKMNQLIESANITVNIDQFKDLFKLNDLTEDNDDIILEED